MKKINILDKNTIDKIAAGEVVDRPASVVKELLENAIDARATAITVEIKDGGISLIRITDNGEGIPKEEIRHAFLRHATSKIESVTDLLTVSSLGFRGEALSSICAVAQVECITKTMEELTGVRYVIEGGEEVSLTEVGAPYGTTFIVRNLFYNTPARKKFLKTAATEGSYISNIIEKLALSHPEISFRLIAGSQTKLHTSGNGRLKDIIYTIYGRDITANLFEINSTREQMSLSGVIGKPVITRGNRNSMICFINGRYINSKIIRQAIEEAYKPYIMPHNYPFTILYFEIDPTLIDVNVHPSKMEIRFENQIELYNFFYDTTKAALSKKEHIPAVKGRDLSEPAAGTGIVKKTPKENSICPESRPVESSTPENSRYENGKRENKPVCGIPENNRCESDKTEYKPACGIPENNSRESGKTEKVRPAEPFETMRQQLSRPYEPVSSTDSVIKETSPEQLSLFDNHFLSKKERVRHKMIGQLFDTYWLIEYDEKLYIIDQHAAHEKVLYEKTMAQLKNKTFTSQQLNPPVILTLSQAEAQMLDRMIDHFTELGYEIESFGGREYVVHAVPDNLYSIGSEELLHSLIGNLTEDSSELKSDLISEKIASMSCKAAVKGNNRLSVEEANALIEQLLSLENPYNCPHGRPTIISMSKYEIERKFKRIL